MFLLLRIQIKFRFILNYLNPSWKTTCKLDLALARIKLHRKSHSNDFFSSLPSYLNNHDQIWKCNEQNCNNWIKAVYRV